MKLPFTLLFVILLNSGYCQDRDSSSRNYQSFTLKKDDSGFLALKDTAQKHIQVFIENLNKYGGSSNYRFGIKSDYVEGDVHEHMWSLISNYSEGKFNGIFIDSALNLKNIKTGDKVSIKEKDVEDWSFYNMSTGKTIGNYSEMYLRKAGH